MPVRTRALWMLPLLVATACSPRLPNAPTHVESDPAFRSEIVENPPGLDPTPAPPFHCAGGDVLSARVTTADGVETYSLLVDAAGTVALPLIGEVTIAGMTLAEAQKHAENELRKLDKFARVGLTIVDPAGHRAMVLGAVEHPGVVPVRPATRVSELLAHGGGTRSTIADGESVDLGDLDAGRIVRNGKPLPVSLSRALAGDPRHDVWVEPGDLVFVPASRGRFITVLGAVKTGRTFPYHRDVRLTEALARAGGMTASADLGDVRVLRGPLSSPKVYRASLKALFAGEAPDVPLAPGDVVFVTEHWFWSTTDVLQRLTPLLATAALSAALL